MITKIVTLGDSWVYGDELGDDHHRQQRHWPRLVADHFQIGLQNLGFNGESQQSAIWSMLWWMENDFDPNAMVIVGLTESSRVSWYRASHATDTVPGHAHINITAPFDDRGCRDLKRLHLGISACDTLHRYNRYQTIFFFDGIGKHYQLPMFYFDLFPDDTDFFGSNHAYRGENASAWVGQNIKPFGHPDEDGHVIIANKLIYWIESAKLVK